MSEVFNADGSRKSATPEPPATAAAAAAAAAASTSTDTSSHAHGVAVDMLAESPTRKPAPPPSTATKSDDGGASEILNATAFLFEQEARTELLSVLQAACPFMEWHDDIMNRSFERIRGTPPRREADAFCYMTEKSTEPCVHVRERGVFVVPPPGPDGRLVSAAVSCIAGSEVASPGAPAAKAYKYAIAEAYSGNNNKAITDKVTQLETLLQHVIGRHVDRLAAKDPELMNSEHGLRQMHDVYARFDVTSLVGVAAIVLSADAGDGARKAKMEAAQAKVAEAIQRNNRDGAAASPHLRRLATAGRLLIVVQDRRQAPATFAQRAMLEKVEQVSSASRSTGTLLAALDGRLKAMDDRLTAMDDRLTAMDDRLTAMDDRLTAMEAKHAKDTDRLTAVEVAINSITRMLQQVLDRLPAQ